MTCPACTADAPCETCATRDELLRLLRSDLDCQHVPCLGETGGIVCGRCKAPLPGEHH